MSDIEEKELLKKIAVDKLLKLGVVGDAEWQKRFMDELREVVGKDEVGYFLKVRNDCVQKRLRYENENNSIIPYLLGICREFDITKPPAFDYGEFPDIDIDYIDGVREYLKEIYAKQLFGEEYVCNIANYNTFGMKSALTDMARVFGLDHEEVKAVTKHLKDKDEDGGKLTWEDALELFDDLREYCDKHPEVAEAAKHMMGRIRGRGQHASGLIVSSVPIREYIPLIAGKGESPASAWTEGQSASDCSTVGFIKFDFLGLDGNSKIADTCKMACQAAEKLKKEAEHAELIVNSAVGEMTVCALPGLDFNGNPYPSWSDTSYLDDPKSIAMANRGDLRMIFQFDGSPGIRNLARQGGVRSFDDLVAYTALYRPGPMKLGYHEEYCKRAKGEKEWTVHPLLAEGQANLSFTYGVLAYQEQIARMLNTVGQVPWKDCEIIRKAISKKKIEKFIKYKNAFIEGGQQTLGQTREYLEELWEQIEAFAGYGFNLSHAVGYTYISARMLWLKAHLPNHFFASMFTHTKASGPKDYQKLKEYKREASKCGVQMSGIDLNKSKNHFVVNEDGRVYYGFTKIKGIGEEVAQRIEDMQPYTGFEDFLMRFGTDAKTVQAFIALGCFKERDPITLYKFYEYYKKWEKGENDRIKRFETTKKKLEEQLEGWQRQLDGLLAKGKDERAVELLEAGMDPENDGGEEFLRDEIEKLHDKLAKAIANKEKKDQFIERPCLATFDPDNPEMKLKLSEEYMAILNDPTGEAAQVAFYGYVWTHPIERCENYNGHTFDEFIDSNDPDGKVECLIKEITKKKGPKATFYSSVLEDATGTKKKMTIWEDDFLRFEEELKVGNFVRLHVDAPHPVYRTFMLHQFKGGRYRKPAKTSDYRVVQLT